MVASSFASHLTFKGNLAESRYGWLRLTPAYSVHMIAELLEGEASADMVVLDPFCGTGTTALACAERGIACDTTDINPFLLWLAQVKTRPYTAHDLDEFGVAAQRVARALCVEGTAVPWVPALHQIEKWWLPDTLARLAHAWQAIQESTREIGENASNLLKIAFCRIMIETSHASFNHQSMSFKKVIPLTLPFADMPLAIATAWDKAIASLAHAASSPLLCLPHMVSCDARRLTTKLAEQRYTHVITSPPYPNRISYIRELRPYMYWLGYLTNGHDAGELDWQAIGGTWGCATSNLTKWQPETSVQNPYKEFHTIIETIASNSSVLARYIEKYFHDMAFHCTELFRTVRHGGKIYYIVGNSKFYDQILPVEQIFAALFEAVGFVDITIATIRKRSSKKELREFLVSAKRA